MTDLHDQSDDDDPHAPCDNCGEEHPEGVLDGGFCPSCCDIEEEPEPPLNYATTFHVPTSPAVTISVAAGPLMVIHPNGGIEFPGTMHDDERVKAICDLLSETWFGLTKDAARYRWLRADNAYAPEEDHVRGGEDLDKLCDYGLGLGPHPHDRAGNASTS